MPFDNCQTLKLSIVFFLLSLSQSGTMTRLFKPPTSCAAFLLLLNATVFMTQSSVPFVRAQNQKSLRVANQITSVQPQRELQEEDDAEKNNKDKNNKDKNNKNKDKNDKEKDKESSEPDIKDDKTDLGNDDTESSGTAPSFSIWSLEQTNLMPTESNVDSLTDVVDGSKFIAAAKLQPITFNMNVKKVTTATDTTALQSFIKNFIEDVLNMKSNRDWYPSHSKSVDNLSIDLVTENVDALPSAVVLEGARKQNSGDKHTIPVKLTVNGVVFVHAKNEDAQVTAAATRKKDDPQPRTIAIEDSNSTSTFYDSFDHSMLLYYTFWGVDDLEKVLQKDGGLRKPVIDSVTLGKKEVIAFGVDKDTNFAYSGDHSSNKPKRSQATAMSQVGSRRSSGARVPAKHGVLTFLLISATRILF